MKYNKIALVGMMGSGKSTIGKALAQITGFRLLELDEIFEKRENIKIKDFFEQFGEENFRKKESQILFEALESNNVIISSGGGVILDKKNREILFSDEILTIYLEASAENIHKRLKNDTTRPLLAGDEPLEKIKKILSEREKFYNLAKIKINTNNKSIDEITEEIRQKL